MAAGGRLAAEVSGRRAGGGRCAQAAGGDGGTPVNSSVPGSTATAGTPLCTGMTAASERPPSCVHCSTPSPPSQTGPWNLLSPTSRSVVSIACRLSTWKPRLSGLHVGAAIVSVCSIGLMDDGWRVCKFAASSAHASCHQLHLARSPEVSASCCKHTHSIPSCIATTVSSLAARQQP